MRQANNIVGGSEMDMNLPAVSYCSPSAGSDNKEGSKRQATLLPKLLLYTLTSCATSLRKSPCLPTPHDLCLYNSRRLVVFLSTSRVAAIELPLPA